MDMLKGLAEKAKTAASGSSSSTSSSSTNAAAGSQGQQDYLDKALAEAERRTGHSQSAATNEKITDKARAFYEKETGSKVNPKWSN